MRAVNESGLLVKAELGFVRTNFSGPVILAQPDHDCAIIFQGDQNNIKAVALFEVEGDKITRFDLYIP
ncbi:MAG: hypothetical protein KA369_05800 [Spirochaetes bacterium]|nr:hypothetical protein [Spirochaetota bacterium]